MAERIGLTKDGMARIVGKAPGEALLNQIKHRIGPDEAAVVVSEATVKAWLRATRPSWWRRWLRRVVFWRLG